MRNTSLILLCCCGLLVACDKSTETASQVTTGVQDETSTMTSEVSTVASDMSETTTEMTEAATEVTETATEVAPTEEAAIEATSTEAVSEELDSALQSAKEAADSLSDSALESAGDTEASVKASSSQVVADTSDKLAEGEGIYKIRCMACHGAGVAGAPKLGDKPAWEPRIAKGEAVLIKHALEGFKGDTGYMPAKGGFSSMSDDEVILAVQYMVSEG